MTTTAGEPDFYTPNHLLGGLYANNVQSWFSPHEFTLDFGVEPAKDEIGRYYVTVARVRLGRTRFFWFVREMNDLLNAYEKRWGSIHVPGADEEPPLYPPDDLEGGT